MQHENLPATIRPEPRFELEPQVVHGTLAAPENGFPHFEGYNLVYIQQHFGDAAMQQAAAAQRHAQYQQESARAAAKATAPAKRKKLIGRDAAIWICVLQLGVIIWWLLAQGNAQRVHTEIKNFFAANNATSTAKNAKQVAFNNSKKQVVQNRFGKAVVPPPPPEMAMPTAKMMVPPPPVAYSLNPAGPGAVAASTLPAPRTVHFAKPAAGTIDTADSGTEVKDIEAAVPAEHATTASVVPVEEAQSTETASADTAERPSWMEKMPNYPSWTDAMNVSAAAPEQAQPIRTVMQGNRKRTITDR